MSIIKKFNRLEKYTKYSIYIIVIFSMIILSLASIYHVSGDGCWHIPVGKFIATSHKIPLFEPLGRDEPFWSPPVYHIFVAAVYYIFSAFNSNIANSAVKFVSPAFGILSVIFSFLVIKKLVNSKIAFYSVLFLAFIPIFIDYSVISYAEGILTFFVILSVYFLINGKPVLSGVAAGLSVLAKYNGIFILPVLVYILHKKYGNKKSFYKNAFAVVAISLLIASPWLIRNFILLGNPIWPFLDFIFRGIEAKSYSSLDFSRLIHYNLVLFAYFGFFGVPDGNYSLLSFFDMPYFNILLPIWLIGTLIFAIPLFVGFKTKKEKGYLIAWVLSYLILFFLYVINVGWAVSRMMLPAFPAIAVLWAFGFEKLQGCNFRKLVNLVFILVIIGLLLTEFTKIRLAADAWEVYSSDFDWVKTNTKSNDVFVANGQCIPYNIERTALYANDENLRKADYVWVNQNFALDKRSIFGEQSLKDVQAKNYSIIYSNKKTGTMIYSTRQ